MVPTGATNGGVEKRKPAFPEKCPSEEQRMQVTFDPFGNVFYPFPHVFQASALRTRVRKNAIDPR